MMSALFRRRRLGTYERKERKKVVMRQSVKVGRVERTEKPGAGRGRGCGCGCAGSWSGSEEWVRYGRRCVSKNREGKGKEQKRTPPLRPRGHVRRRWRWERCWRGCGRRRLECLAYVPRDMRRRHVYGAPATRSRCWRGCGLGRGRRRFDGGLRCVGRDVSIRMIGDERVGAIRGRRRPLRCAWP